MVDRHRRHMEACHRSKETCGTQQGQAYLHRRRKMVEEGYSQEGGDYGDPGNGGYMNDMSGGHGMMPPRAPFGPPGPSSTIPKARPNYTKLGTCTKRDFNVMVGLTGMNRPYQIRHAISRPPNPANAVPARIQTKR